MADDSVRLKVLIRLYPAKVCIEVFMVPEESSRELPLPEKRSGRGADDKSIPLKVKAN